MLILSIIGTRPEAVKMAPVIKQLTATHGVTSVVCVTGQHRDLLDQVLSLFKIIPDFDLDVMRANQSLSSLTSEIILGLDAIIKQVKPDWVLVQGDTTTAMAASLVAYYQKVPVGHIEAGLRTNDKYQPFPEEINRRIVSAIADLHFAPTESARDNLMKEGIRADQVTVTGNPVIDALQSASLMPLPKSIEELLTGLGFRIDLKQANEGVRIVLVTAHRRENFGAPLENICYALKSLADEYQGRVKFIYPVHPNPNVQDPVNRILSDHDHIILLPPLDYLQFVHIMKSSFLVLTDSGGLQEEAPGFGVPVLVMRDVTERPEGVQAGTVKLVGTDTDKIIQETRQLLDDPVAYANMATSVNPYGDGHASERIVASLLRIQSSK